MIRKRRLARPSQSLSSADKIYSFKRLGQDIQFRSGVTAGNSAIELYQASSPSYTTMSMGTAVTDWNGTQSVPIGMSFMLGAVENSSDITNLFDMYTIKGVKVKITYIAGNSTNQQGWNPQPTMLYAIDNDDSSSNFTESVIRQKNDVKSFTFTGNKSLSIYLKPKGSTQLHDSATSSGFTGYGPVRNQYVDSNYPGCPFYGLKIYLKNITLPHSVSVPTIASPLTLAPFNFRVETTYYISCKGVQ